MTKIGTSDIGTGRVYVIAEAGVNHNGDIALAKKLIDAAKDAAADAVKFQTFTPSEMVTEHAEQAAYQTENTGVTESQASMLEKLALTHEHFKELKMYAEAVNIEFLSTPFSEADADFLHSLDIAAFKVSSGDITNTPFLAHLARFGKPVILSTGMATLAEVEEAVTVLRARDASDIIILQCTSEYPSPLSHANLAVLATFRELFGGPVGYSDHTEGIEAAVYAASLGATVIEKHFTLDRTLPGPDHLASLEPAELTDMIRQIRAAAPGSVEVPADVLGSGEKKPWPEEIITAKLVRKGIATRADVRAGEQLNRHNALIARPEGAILPKDWERVLGRTARVDIPAGTSLTWDMLQ